MDRLFEVKPVWKANRTNHAEDAARESEFRQDAQGTGLSVAKEKLQHVERLDEV